MSLQFTDAVTTTKALLGCELLHRTPEGAVGGIIVETEAYHAADEASHTFRGQTVRNAPMFLSGGHVYVYFTYGMHHCFNIVTGPAGDGQGVLIRALEPTKGVEIMRLRRGKHDIHELASGPAKLVQALGITMKDSGLTLAQAKLSITRHLTPKQIGVSPRRGIRKAVDAPLRFYIVGNAFVS